MTRFMLALFVVTPFAALFAGGAIAADYDLKSLHIEQAFTRATPPGAQVAGAFLTIENRGKDPDRLVGVASPVAGQVAIHEMAVEGGVMKMRAVRGVDLPPGAKVQLRPGGYHVMLESLKQPLKAGDAIPLTLTFEKAGSIDIKVPVEAMGAGMPAH